MSGQPEVAARHPQGAHKRCPSYQTPLLLHRNWSATRCPLNAEGDFIPLSAADIISDYITPDFNRR